MFSSILEMQSDKYDVKEFNGGNRFRKELGVGLDGSNKNLANIKIEIVNNW